MSQIKLGKYKHYKYKEYEVIGIAHHSETPEELVVYRALYESKDFGENSLWVRPLDIFTDEVEIDGRRVKHFEFIG